MGQNQLAAIWRQVPPGADRRAVRFQQIDAEPESDAVLRQVAALMTQDRR